MLGIFRKLFGSDAQQDIESTAAERKTDDRPQRQNRRPEKRSEPAGDSGREPDLEQFVNYVVRALVDNPDAVQVESVPDEKGTVFQVRCEKGDIGKVIGRSGRTIAAIRSLASGAAGRIAQKVRVEIMD